MLQTNFLHTADKLSPAASKQHWPDEGLSDCVGCQPQHSVARCENSSMTTSLMPTAYLQSEIDNALFDGSVGHFLEPAQFEPQQRVGGNEIHCRQRHCNIDAYASSFVCRTLCGLLTSFAQRCQPNISLCSSCTGVHAAASLEMILKSLFPSSRLKVPELTLKELTIAGMDVELQIGM